MAPHSHSTLFKTLTRRSDSTSPSVSPTIIIGFSIAGVVVLGLLFWLGISLYRRHSRKQRANLRGRGTTFLTVKGVVSVNEKGLEFEDEDEIKGVFDALTSKPKFKSAFSRANLTASIAMPSRARVRVDTVTDSDAEVGITVVPPPSSHNSSSSIETRSPEEILSFYASQGTMPKPFRPFSFALSVSSRPVSMRGSVFSVRNSYLNPNSSIYGNINLNLNSNSNRGSMLSVDSSLSGVNASVGHHGNARGTRDERGISYLSPLHAEYLGTIEGGNDEIGGFGFGYDGDEEELAPPEPAFTKGEKRDVSSTSNSGTSRFSSIRNSFLPTFSFPARKAPNSAMAVDSRNSSLLAVKSNTNNNNNRSSIFSISSYTSSFSKRSSLTTSASFGAQISSLGQSRKILQIFTPILPDEPVVKVGEKVVLIHSFDDGWCVVGRKIVGGGGANKMSDTVQSKFSSSPLTNPHAHLQKFLPQNSSDQQIGIGASVDVDMELGTIPAWCFLPPPLTTSKKNGIGSVRVERPIRSSSLGITVNLDGPGLNSGGAEWKREDVISWSNF